MSKRTVFTTITPLPASISRQTVMETLHSHTEMIDLNPFPFPFSTINHFGMIQANQRGRKGRSAAIAVGVVPFIL
jgi:hypothetical protein